MQTTTHCRDGISSATLAAWRDGALSAAEAERIAAHLPECPACRAEVATYDTADAALRRLRAPEPDGRLWQAVRDTLSRNNGSRRRRPTRGQAQRLASRVGAVAAVVLLALGFAQVLQYRATPSARTSATATATSQPQGTPTPIPTAIRPAPAVYGTPPNWQQARLPTPLDNKHFLMFVVAPSDGESAYACNVISNDSGGTATFYRTTDRALHWTALTHVTVQQSSAAIKCYPQVDALDANRVLVQIYVFGNQSNDRRSWYELSEDGGATWTRLDTSDTFSGLATVDGKTYALRQIDGRYAGIWVSVDHLQTWQAVSQALAGTNQWVSNFWLSPDGELLADVTSVSNLPTPGAIIHGPQDMPVHYDALWHSTDGGAHWTPFPAPSISSRNAFWFVVGQPVAGQPWHVCIPYASQGNDSAGSIVCTFDGGQTWSARPQLCTTAPCLPSQVSMSYISLYTLASDGAVLVMARAPGVIDQNGVSGADGLYRLPRGSTTWQYLGIMAGDTYSFAPTPQGGVLWANTGGRNYEALPGLFATAAYPQ